MPRSLVVALVVVLLAVTVTVGGVVTANHAGSNPLRATIGGPVPPIPPHTAVNVLTATIGGPVPPIPPHGVAS